MQVTKFKVISANRLGDGAVVFTAQNGAWIEAIDQAALYASEAEAQARLAVVREDVKRNLIVDPFLVDVAADGDRLRAVSLRDEIRARGPTIDYAPKTQDGRV
jgi:sulfite reductase (NADPH) hemoprotein beta-component